MSVDADDTRTADPRPAGPGSGGPARSARYGEPHARRSVAAGVAALVVVLAAGAVFLATRPSGWTAEATAMVVPDQGLDPAAGAGYYETLSRGHVVATVAELVRLERFRDEAAAELRVDADRRDRVTVDVRVVPNTAVIRIAVFAPDAELAERMADGVLGRATAYDGLPEPYTLVPVSGAGGSAQRRDLTGWRFAAVLLLIAFAVAVAIQQATYHLSAATGRSRRAGAPAEAPRGGREPPA